MRDGASLYTAIYTPKDQSKKYPIIMQRTLQLRALWGTEFKRALVPARL
jgi:predicted acyl esterase